MAERDAGGQSWQRVRSRYLTSGTVATIFVAALGALIGYAGAGLAAAVIAVVVWLVLAAIFMPFFYFRLRRQWRSKLGEHS